MRYHIWKSAPTRFSLLADSHARLFESGNINIFLLPGAGGRHLYDFIPPQSIFDKNILFIGWNYLFDGCDPSSANPQDVARDIVELANCLLHRANESFVLGTPKRNENKLLELKPLTTSLRH